MKQVLTCVVYTCNSSEFIEQTLASILSQTISKDSFKLWVSDDASTDDTLVKVRKLAPHATIFENTRRLGLVPHFNSIAGLIDTPLYVLHSHDDLSMPNRFELQMQQFDRDEQLALCTGQIIAFGERACAFPQYDTSQSKILTFQCNPWLTPTAMLRTKFFDMPRLFNNQFEMSEDYKLWSDTVARGLKIAVLPQVLAQYNMHSSNVSVQRAHQQNQTAGAVMRDFMLQLFPELRLCDAQILAAKFTNVDVGATSKQWNSVRARIEACSVYLANPPCGFTRSEYHIALQMIMQSIK